MMLLTTGAIALGRKIADEKAKRKEKKQGHLAIGNSDVAKRAFAAQTSKMIGDGSAGINRTGTDIKFEDPDDINANNTGAPSGGVYSPDVEVHDARSSSQLSVTSPVQSEKAAFSSGSAHGETPTSAVEWQSSSSTARNSSGTTTELPPYSARPLSSATAASTSVYTRDTDANTLATSDTRSIASGSTNSQGGHGIRVKTKGPDLKSGFPYHPALFDLRIHPDKWEDFGFQIAESTKFDKRDYTRMIGAATATALTGAIATSVWVGRSMNRSLQEDKVRKGLLDTAEGGLGETLKQWNEEYFSELGVFVHMELSESAMKNPGGKSKTFRKPTTMYNSREERARKSEERKFVLVVTKLDEDGTPSQAIHEMGGGDVKPLEIGSSGDTSSKTAEMPGDEGNTYVELPAEVPAENKLDPPEGYVEMEGSQYVEMDGDNSRVLEKLQLEGTLVEADPDAESHLMPKPLETIDESQPLAKETT